MRRQRSGSTSRPPLLLPPQPPPTSASFAAAAPPQLPAAATAAPAAAGPGGAAAAALDGRHSPSADRIREAFFQPGVMHNGLPAAGAGAVHDHIARSISAALAGGLVPAALAALCAALFPGISGMRLAMRVAPTVLAVTSSFMAAGPLAVALAPEHGSASGASLRTSLPQLDENCAHGRRSPPPQAPQQCVGQCPCSVHVPCLPPPVQAAAAAPGLAGGAAEGSAAAALVHDGGAAGGAAAAAAGAGPGGAAEAAGAHVSSCVILDFHCHLLPGLMPHIPAMARLALALEATLRDAAAHLPPEFYGVPGAAAPVPPPPQQTAAAPESGAHAQAPDAAAGQGGGDGNQGAAPAVPLQGDGGGASAGRGRRQPPPSGAPQTRDVRPRRS